MLRGSTPRLLHMFTENVFPDGWGVEPHTALQTETTRSERELLSSNTMHYVVNHISGRFQVGVVTKLQPNLNICSSYFSFSLQQKKGQSSSRLVAVTHDCNLNIPRRLHNIYRVQCRCCCWHNMHCDRCFHEQTIDCRLISAVSCFRENSAYRIRRWVFIHLSMRCAAVCCGVLCAVCGVLCCCCAGLRVCGFAELLRISCGKYVGAARYPLQTVGGTAPPITL